MAVPGWDDEREEGGPIRWQVVVSDVKAARRHERIFAKLKAERPEIWRDSDEQAPPPVEGSGSGPPPSPKAVTAMVGTLESIQADAAIQFKRIAQLQAQLDLTLKALKKMGDKAGRHRTRQ